MDQLAAGLAVTTVALAEELRVNLRDAGVRVLADHGGAGGFEEFLERAGRLRLDALIVELADTAPEREQQFLAMERIPSRPTLIAVQAVAEPDAIMAAMRAGAADYPYPPFGTRIRQSLERIQADRAEREGKKTRARTAAFLSAKGGCGATTVVCHLAREFQRQTAHSLLLADFDVDAGMVRFLLKTKSPYSVVDAARNRDRLDKSFWKALVSNGTPRLEIIAAPDMGSERMPEDAALADVLHFARAQYDWVLADLGRGLNPASLDLLKEVDECYLVTTLELTALYRAKQVVTTLVANGYARDRVRVVLNRVPPSAALTRAEAEAMLGVPVWASIPEAHPELEEACAAGGMAASNGPLGAHYARLAAKMAGLASEPERPKKRFGLF